MRTRDSRGWRSRAEEITEGGALLPEPQLKKLWVGSGSPLESGCEMLRCFQTLGLRRRLAGSRDLKRLLPRPAGRGAEPPGGVRAALGKAGRSAGAAAASGPGSKGPARGVRAA